MMRPVTKLVDITHSAFLEAGLTVYEYRRQCVATATIQEAETLSKRKGMYLYRVRGGKK